MSAASSVAVIGGGASGLGRAAADLLKTLGHTVVILDLPSSAGRVDLTDGFEFVGADVRDGDAVEAAVAHAASLGPVRVGVSCAGIGAPQRIARKGVPMPLTQFTQVIEVNLIGTFNLLRCLAATMQGNEPIDAERGVLVATASVAAFDGQIGQAAYSASKGGIVGMTLPIARDLSSDLIRLVTIAPGIFDTPLLGTLSDDVRAALEASVPHPARLGDPSEYAQLVEQIIANRMLNGETIRLDGALRMPPR
jgi:NAD(P)-dependent dehydrogenase (short-subunit alcohol dehydrogenase family)